MAALVFHLDWFAAGSAEAADTAQAHAVDTDFDSGGALDVVIAIAIESGDGHRERNMKTLVSPPAHIGLTATICGPEKQSKRECTPCSGCRAEYPSPAAGYGVSSESGTGA